MKKKTNDNLKNKYLLIGLSVFCVALILLSFFEGDAVAPVRQVSGFVITPIQKGINGFGSWLSGLTDNFDDAVTLRAKNEELQAKVDTLTEENSQLVQDKEELTRLRELYDLDQQYTEYPKVAAEIISKDPGNWYDTFMINRGSADGIRVDNNVIAGKGLVGIVTEVGTHWATVRSIIDDSSNVSAMTVSTQDNCVVEGDLELIDEGKLSFSQLYDQDNKVTVGERIVTSNISEKYVEGLFIGYVSDIQQDSNNLTKTGTIVTPVDFQHLKDVLVITVNKQDSITEGGQNEE